ncbi:hypothetical protein ANA_C13531 [Anabaena sp. 90]|uniref:metallophosphoesterase n=1 Tax=Anabaena sp. 90 TaxID=46234 RepID=UPI00029B75DA|nr:metallophosphoesterase [Anabaena sp. 90]AFW96193.1 hypothetical protein ANA_C13531 [Anabaena sp. 90]
MKTILNSQHPLILKLAASVLVFLSVFITGINSESFAAAEKVTFAAYGDMPYFAKSADGRTDEQVLIQDIAPKFRQREDIPFVIHLGDLGRPQDTCYDTWLEKNKTFWKSDIVKPVFFTPGDNDWTDCDREGLAVRKSELERLDAIRKVFFSQPKTLNPEWRYEEQATLPENETWWYKGVRFVTEHIVSTDNGRTEIFLDDPIKVNQLVDERDKENAIWLNHAFEMAKDSDTSAVVVATQLDPFAPDGSTGDVFSRCLNNHAYKGFCEQLQTLAANLDKPVLLVHGDTNAYCFDQPFPVGKTPKLWRLNAPGDFKVIDASFISFDPSNSSKPFEVTGLLSGKEPPQICDYSR